MQSHSPSLRDEDVRSDPVPLSRRWILAALVAAGVPIGLLFLPYGLVSHGNSEGAAMASAMLMLSWSGSPYLTLAKLFSDGINDPPVVLIVLANLALLFSPCLYVVLLRQDDGYRGLRIGSLFLGILGLLSYPFMGGLLSFQLFSTVTLLPGYYLILSWLAFSMVLNFVMSAGECRRGLRRLLLGRPPKNRAAA